MCTISCQKNALPNSASNGSTSTARPSSSRKPGRVLHPAVDADHHQRAAEAGDHDRDPGEHVRARRQAVPAVDVDRDEDRLDEEREALERERQAEDVAVGGHELRPQQPELEREDRPRHDADREQGDHRLRPAAGEREQQRVAAAAAEPLHPQDERRERDAEAHERDVDRERQRLHLPRLEQILLLNGPERLRDLRQHPTRVLPSPRPQCTPARSRRWLRPPSAPVEPAQTSTSPWRSRRHRRGAAPAPGERMRRAGFDARLTLRERSGAPGPSATTGSSARPGLIDSGRWPASGIQNWAGGPRRPRISRWRRPVSPSSPDRAGRRARVTGLASRLSGHGRPRQLFVLLAPDRVGLEMQGSDFLPRSA